MPRCLQRGVPPPFDLDERLHVLQEVELLVGCCGPEANIGENGLLTPACLDNFLPCRR